ncbi:helix-turn-helix transcriptional regulator [Archangium lansingense]|uniref:helix-turn-helix transcriptional regulator n=1 Tax=Archangium lansingense TaxID=2995310 RepID=UPI003B7B7ED0
MKKDTHLTKKMMTVHLGEVLRKARLKAELTQADVADRVGVATEVYGRMERGNLTPSVLTLRTLCVVLRLNASAALGLEDGEAATWLQESEPTPEESPQMRRLLRTLRQLDDKQLTAVGYVARSLVQPEAR